MSRDIDKDFRVPNSNKVYTCHSGCKIEKKYNKKYNLSVLFPQILLTYENEK